MRAALLTTCLALVAVLSFPAGGEMDDDDVYDVGDYCVLASWHEWKPGDYERNTGPWHGPETCREEGV